MIRNDFRLARREDLPVLLILLTDDDVAKDRGHSSTRVDEGVLAAFAEIEADPSSELWVVTQSMEVVGTAQLNVIPGLGRGGTKRALVESVRVRSDLRGQGIGEAFMQHLMNRSRQRGCQLMQLTSDKRRTDAHRFYERIGFVATHEGMKRRL